MSAHELSVLLRRQRELLELLLYRLEVEQLLLTAGKTRWLPQLDRELELAVERLRESELERSVAADAVADEWGAPVPATLTALIAAAPGEPWTGILTDHRDALGELVAQIGAVRDANEGMIRQSVRAVQETLASIETEAGVYGADGSPRSARSSAHIVDRNI